MWEQRGGGGGGGILTMSFVVLLRTRSYFLCRTSLSIATRTDFCIRLEMTWGWRRGVREMAMVNGWRHPCMPRQRAYG